MKLVNLFRKPIGKEDKMNKDDILKVVTIICTTVLAGLIVIFAKDIITAVLLEGITAYYILKEKDM